MDLSSRIENARTLLSSGRLANEAAVSHGVVLPLLDALGWPVFDPNIVVPEYSLEGRRVDFALLTRRSPAVFVEVKQPGLSDGADRQLFEYAFHVGVPMALLTDGATWHFYLPAEQGTYQERRVYLLDLIERSLEESTDRLQRYLSYDAVVSGDAYEQARRDYQRARTRREARDALPRAWGQLVAAADPDLVDLIVAEVESTSGYKPDPSDVVDYLKSLGRPEEKETIMTTPARTRKPRQRRSELPSPPQDPQPPARKDPSEPRTIGFTLGGVFHPARNGRDVFVQVFQALAEHDPSFLDRFIALPEHGRTRRYLARSAEALYPDDPDFAGPGTAAEVKPGYWLMINVGNQGKLNIIEMACGLTDLQFGKDLKVSMG